LSVFKPFFYNKKLIELLLKTLTKKKRKQNNREKHHNSKIHIKNYKNKAKIPLFCMDKKTNKKQINNKKLFKQIYIIITPIHALLIKKITLKPHQTTFFFLFIYLFFKNFAKKNTHKT